MTATTPAPALPNLHLDAAETYAAWFACLAEPTRVRLLHAIASAPEGSSVGALAAALGIGQPTVSHHLRKLAEVGFITMTKEGTSTLVAISPDCCTGLPHAADAVMGLLAARPCCPTDLPPNVAVRAMESRDADIVRTIYAEGIATGDATFETEVPAATVLAARWLPDHRWVAEIDGAVVGWAATSPASDRACYSGVAETAVYVGEGARGRGVGKTLIHKQVTAADAGGLWTLQTAIFPENKAALALHHSAGFRTLGVRERIARHHGRWRDTILLERRRADDSAGCPQDAASTTGGGSCC